MAPSDHDPRHRRVLEQARTQRLAPMQDDDGDVRTELDDWAGWDPYDFPEYWRRIFAIQQAGHTGKAELKQTLKSFGIHDARHFQRVQETFHRYFRDEPRFRQAAVDARSALPPATDAAPRPVAPEATEPTPPCPFERWVELETARRCWAEQGVDVEALFAREFGVSPRDWTAMRSYWSARVSADVNLAAQYAPLERAYRARRRATR